MANRMSSTTRSSAGQVGASVLSGDKELLAVFAGLRENVQRKIVRPALVQAIKPIVATAKRNVPVDSGLLRRAITGSVGKRGVVAKVYISSKVWKVLGAMGIQKPAKYAHLVEFGTSHSTPEPFLRPALSSNKSFSLSIIRDGIKSGLNKYVKRNAKVKK